MNAVGHGIVMTDLFISATAALLLVLAVLKPTPPVPLPIQADIVAHCPDDELVPGAPLALVAAGDPDGVPVVVDSAAGLGTAPALLGLPPRLLYIIAVDATGSRPLSVACLDWVTRDFVRAYNGALAETRTPGEPRAIFTVSAAAPESGGESR